MNKPRLKKIDKLWFCGIKGDWLSWLGTGYTPESAYLDWSRNNMRTIDAHKVGA